MNTDQPCLRVGSVLAAFIATGIALTAQTAPASAPEDEEKIVLSEFRVDASKDRGYVATNATTGTRLNMPIKDMPMPIEVITREFIDDIGAVDIKESLQYSAGVVQDFVQSGNNFTFSPSGTGQSTGALSRDSASVNIRGFNTRSFLRSGFRLDTVTDVVNVDRQEVARGPQSLLYGVAALGGIVNITPKYPRSQQRSTLRVGVGSNDFYRGELYNTGPLYKSDNGKRSLNYGIGVVYQKLGSPFEFDTRRRTLFTPAIEFRPFENTNIFVDIEWGKFKANGNSFRDIDDASAGNVRDITGLRVAENKNVYNETLQVAKDRWGKSRFYRMSGADPYAYDDYFSGTVEVTQKIFPQLTLVAAGNYSDRDTERLTLDSQGVVTQNTASTSVLPTQPGLWTAVGPNPTNPAQTYWKSINYQWGRPLTHKLIWQTRFDLNYEFNLWGNKQDILVGRMDQTVRQSDISTAQVTSNVAGGSNRSYIPFTGADRISYQGEQTRVFRDSVFYEWNTGEYAIYQGRWWRDRITTIGGMRWDSYMVRVLNYTYGKVDPNQPDSVVSNWARPANYDDIIGYTSTGAGIYNNPGANNGSAANQTTRNDTPRKNGYRFNAETQRETSPTAGVSVALTKNISVYALTAAGIFPNTGQRNGAGDPFQAEKTKSKEVGVKFDLWKNRRGTSRISGAVAWFQIDRQNAIYNLFWAPQPRSNNQATLRAGFTGNTAVSGTGPNAYSVTNSGYTSFQTDKPVTYLLPISYVAAADLNSPRVTGAPQQNNLILVDYASLGSAASDPLRRAMDAAATDPASFTALGTGSTGTGATGLYANNAYMNRNSDTAYEDRTRGVDLQLYLNFTDNLSSVVTYTYLTQGVTGGFKVVDQPSSTEYDSWWNYMNVPLEARRANKDESSYSFVGGIKGARTIDNPRNQIGVWTKYDFTSGPVRGLNVGVGVNWSGERQSEVTINNGARDLHQSENIRFKPWYAADYRVNLGIGYQTRIMDRRWNFRLNVNNVLDNQKRVDYGTSTMYIDPATGAPVASTTAGAQQITVPERAVRYFDPISYRLVVSTAF